MSGVYAKKLSSGDFAKEQGGLACMQLAGMNHNKKVSELSTPFHPKMKRHQSSTYAILSSVRLLTPLRYVP